MIDTLWAASDLDRLTDIEVVDVCSRRTDGSWSPWRPIWIVVVDRQLYIRSTDGPDKAWFHYARIRGAGRIRADASTYAVRFENVDPTQESAITAEYRRKYAHRPDYNVNRAASSTSTLTVLPDDSPGKSAKLGKRKKK